MFRKKIQREQLTCSRLMTPLSSTLRKASGTLRGYHSVERKPAACAPGDTYGVSIIPGRRRGARAAACAGTHACDTPPNLQLYGRSLAGPEARCHASGGSSYLGSQTLYHQSCRLDAVCSSSGCSSSCDPHLQPECLRGVKEHEANTSTACETRTRNRIRGTAEVCMAL